MQLRLRRSRRTADSALLGDLIGSTAPGQPARLRPVVLRSRARQRQDTLAPYAARTWVDTTLALVERGLVLGVLFVWLGWFAEGWGQDLLHAMGRQEPRMHEAPRVVQQQAAAPPVVQQQPAAPRQEHPELGASLPVVDERWERPAAAADYLVPARSYVPPRASAPVEPALAVEAAQPLPEVDLRPTHVIAPAIGLDSSVVEVFVVDGAWQVADYAVGYHHGTGEAGSGNVVLAGHKGLRGGVFRKLESLHAGDDIWIDAGGQRFHYRVSTTGSVWPQQVEVMFPTPRPRLTLLTCTNWDMQRFVVVADFVDSAAAPQAGGI